MYNEPKFSEFVMQIKKFEKAMFEKAERIEKRLERIEKKLETMAKMK